MSPEQVRSVLDSSQIAQPFLLRLGCKDPERGHLNLVAFAELGIPLDLLAVVFDQLSELLPRSPDADMALNNLERYLQNCTSPLSAAALFERDPAALSTLVQLFGTSQYFSDLVIASPPLFEWLRTGWRGARQSETLRDELCAELRALPESEVRLNAIRRFRQAEMLRIGYRDIIRDIPLEVVTGEVSSLAAACVAAALDLATSTMIDRHGRPRLPDG